MCTYSAYPNEQQMEGRITFTILTAGNPDPRKLQLEAALCDVIHFRNQGLGRLHFAIAERLSDQFVDHV